MELEPEVVARVESELEAQRGWEREVAPGWVPVVRVAVVEPRDNQALEVAPRDRVEELADAVARPVEALVPAAEPRVSVVEPPVRVAARPVRVAARRARVAEQVAAWEEREVESVELAEPRWLPAARPTLAPTVAAAPVVPVMPTARHVLSSARADACA